MNTALENRRNGLLFETKFYKNGAECQNDLSKVHYHVISIDQNIPARESETVEARVGMSLVEKIESTCPSTKKIIYTAYGESHYKSSAEKFECYYWEKSLTGRDDVENNVYSVHGWANGLLNILSVEYLPYALAKSAKYLPSDIAKLLNLLSQILTSDVLRSNSLQPEAIRDILVCSNNLWEVTIHLAWAQSMALKYQLFGLPIVDQIKPESPTESPKERKQSIQDFWKRFRSTGWLEPWKPYIDAQDQLAKGQGIVHPDIDQKPERFSEMSTQSLQSNLQTQIEGLYFLLDALAFWTSNPFLYDLKVCENRGRPKGKTILSASLLRNRTDRANAEFLVREFPDSTEKNNAVYIPWRDPNGETIILNLSPFIQLERTSATEIDLSLVSYLGKDQHWYRRSLKDDRYSKWEPEQHELEVLKKVFSMD